MKEATQVDGGGGGGGGGERRGDRGGMEIVKGKEQYEGKEKGRRKVEKGKEEAERG